MTALHKLIWRTIGVSMLLGLPSACGGSPAAGAESPGRDALSSDLEQKAAELEAALARLEGERDQTTPSPGADSDSLSGGLPFKKETTVEEAKSEPGVSTSSPAPPPEEQREISPRERCKTACRALASMARSANGICSLVGDAHEKCVWARTQVRDARHRMDQAGCDCD